MAKTRVLAMVYFPGKINTHSDYRFPTSFAIPTSCVWLLYRFLTSLLVLSDFFTCLLPRTFMVCYAPHVWYENTKSVTIHTWAWPVKQPEIPWDWPVARGPTYACIWHVLSGLPYSSMGNGRSTCILFIRSDASVQLTACMHKSEPESTYLISP